MITGRQIMLLGLAVLAFAAVVIFVLRLVLPAGAKAEVDGIVPFLSIGGVLGFLSGLALVVYDQSRFETLGLAIAFSGAAAVCGSILISRARSKTL